MPARIVVIERAMARTLRTQPLVEIDVALHFKPRICMVVLCQVGDVYQWSSSGSSSIMVRGHQQSRR